jgi:hypothetical protein
MRDIAVAAFKGELAKHGFLPPGEHSAQRALREAVPYPSLLKLLSE